MEIKMSKKHKLSKSDLILLGLLSLGGLIITLAAPTALLGMRLLLGPCFSLLAFLLYRSYWGLAVALPSALATIWLFGSPLTAYRLLAEIGVITWLNRKGSNDQAIRSGRIIRDVAIFAVLIGCPFLYFTEVYSFGTPHNIALTLSYKNFITSIVNVLVSYAIYSWIELRRNRRLEGSRHRISLKTLTSVVLMLTCILLSYSFIRREFTIASDRSQLMIIQRNASLASLIQQIDRSNPIKNSRDLEELFTDPMYTNTQKGKGQKAASINEYDIDLRDDRVFLVKPEGEKEVWLRLKANQNEKALEYTPEFFTNNLPKLEVFENNWLISDQLKVLAPSKGSRLDRLIAGYWAYTYPDNHYSDLKGIQIFTPLKAYVRELAESTNTELQLLTQVVVISLLVSNLIASKLTNEWAAILPKKSSNENNIEELYKQSPITEINESVASINERTSEIISAKKQIEYLNAITQRQLSTAAEIQRFFLAKIFPKGLSYEVTALTRPAYDVGGDWYDTFTIGKHSFFVVADVCDKGVGSALFMSVFRTLIRYSTNYRFREKNVADMEKAMVDVITDVNEYMSTNHGDATYFATVFFGHLHEDNSNLCYVSAGHETVLIRKGAGDFEELEATGPALGIFSGANYTSCTTGFVEGETMLAYTDGVIDARNPRDEGYSIDRVKEYFDRRGDHTVNEMQDGLLHELDQYMGGSEQFDDITMMFIERLNQKH